MFLKVDTNNSQRGRFVGHEEKCWCHVQMSGQGDAESTEESALAAMQIDKMSARQLLHQSLPVPTDVLGAHQRALANVGQKARQNRQQDDIRARSAAMQRVDAHPSYQLVVAGVLATSGGAHHTPMELAEAAETAATNAAQVPHNILQGHCMRALCITTR